MYTWTVQPPLPLGLALSPASGVISGSPSELMRRTGFTITASNGDTTTSLSFQMAVVDGMKTNSNIRLSGFTLISLFKSLRLQPYPRAGRTVTS